MPLKLAIIYVYVVREEGAKRHESEFSAKSLGFIFDVVGACEKRSERSPMIIILLCEKIKKRTEVLNLF